MNEEKKILVANGEFGRVIEVHENKVIVELENPKRRVLVPRGKQPEKKEGSAAGDDDGPKTGCDLDLGYAVTCHKMQGSSAPIVLVVLDDYPGATGELGVCDRAWLFTAISRAEKICLLLGMMATALSMCRRSFIKRRKTFLAEDLAAGMAVVGKPWSPPAADGAGAGDLSGDEQAEIAKDAVAIAGDWAPAIVNCLW